MSRDEFALREQSFARNTDSQLDDFIGQAQNLLENLTDQHSILKVKEKKVLQKKERMNLFILFRKLKKSYWILQIPWDYPKM